LTIALTFFAIYRAPSCRAQQTATSVPHRVRVRLMADRGASEN